MEAKILILLTVFTVGVFAEKDIHAYNDTTDGFNRFRHDSHHDDSDDHHSDMVLSSFIGDFHVPYQNLTDKEAGEEFEKVINAEIDYNHDGMVTFTEVKEWVINKAEQHTGHEIPKEEYDVIDANKDKKFSLDEVMNDYKKHHRADSDDPYQAQLLATEKKKEEARFRFADVNKDGFVTENELARMIYPDHFRDSLKLLKEDFLIDYDVNGDGIVTEKEYIRRSEDHHIETSEAEEHFKSHDSNKDGKLDNQEIESAVETDSTYHHVLEELKEIFLTASENVFVGIPNHTFVTLHHYFTEESPSLSHEIEHDEL